jgi:hypothetical protein
MEKVIHNKERISSISEMGKKSRILKKLQITKENLSRDEILPILEKLKITKSGFSMEMVEKIFSEFDTHNLGYISKDNFANFLLSKSFETEKNEIASLLENFDSEDILSNSHKIIEKLKKLKNKSWIQGDQESCDDIQWIISVFNDQDIFEPEYDQMRLNSDVVGIENLQQYSQIENSRRRESDLLVLKDKMIATNGSIRGNDNQNRRRSTQLSTFVSPSLFGKILAHLENVNTLDFDIFDLNELVDRKTVFYITYEIFSRENYFESMIDEDKFKNFINEIISGYNRKIPYHNDLHAGDVLQTIYHIIDRTDIKNVFILLILEIETE